MDAADFRTFRPDRLARLAEMEGSHFWLAVRRRRVDRLLAQIVDQPRDILDLGAGTGWLSERLDRGGHRVTAIDTRPEGLDELRQRAPGVTTIRGDVALLPLADATADVALLLDVLEHVDDLQAMSEVARVLRPGGHSLITVPASPWLWSFRDHDAGHRRRYTAASLGQLLAAAGLSVELLRHYGALLLPAMVASRLVGRAAHRVRDVEDRPPAAANSLLGAVASLDDRVCARVALPFGSSIAAIATKPT